MKQLDMFDGITDFGKPREKQSRGRWYVITRYRNSEALYMIEGRYEWREYDPLTSVPHAFTSPIKARRLINDMGFRAEVRMWPYGVLKPGRGQS